jgi:hypothetical protein
MSARRQTSGRANAVVGLAARDLVAGLAGAPRFCGVAVGTRAVSPIGGEADEGLDDGGVEVRPAPA